MSVGTASKVDLNLNRNSFVSDEDGFINNILVIDIPGKWCHYHTVVEVVVTEFDRRENSLVVAH